MLCVCLMSNLCGTKSIIITSNIRAYVCFASSVIKKCLCLISRWGEGPPPSRLEKVKGMHGIQVRKLNMHVRVHLAGVLLNFWDGLF